MAINCLRRVALADANAVRARNGGAKPRLTSANAPSLRKTLRETILNSLHQRRTGGGSILNVTIERRGRKGRKRKTVFLSGLRGLCVQPATSVTRTRSVSSLPSLKLRRSERQRERLARRRGFRDGGARRVRELRPETAASRIG